ncbi:MAG TPA: SOS response-associated peptidase [Steroidobacteraceae bacterium]|jgi:putative SOS response-associated peptidase YedK
MCERYVLPVQEAAEREFEPADRWWKFSSSFNVSSSQYVPAIRAHEGRTEAVMMRWGLVPASAEGAAPEEEHPSYPFEELTSAPVLRGPWLHGRRCIMPASGFYAWRLTSLGYRQPYFFGPRDRTVFGFAGIWEQSVSDEDDVIESCAIITVPANSLVCGVIGRDARMPAILRRKDYETWLTGTPVQAKAVLNPYLDQWMRAHPVSPRVNSTKNNDVSLIRPIA